MTDPSETEEYHKNTKAQYEALGRFVENFELLVNEVRECTLGLIERDSNHRRLLQIILHHRVMTAAPLFDMFRAVVSEIVLDARRSTESRAKGFSRTLIEGPHFRTSSPGVPIEVTREDEAAIFGALTVVSGEYGELESIRNNLLHATWFVGYATKRDPTAKQFIVRKFKTTKLGLKKIDLPKEATEIDRLSSRCDELRSWVAAIYGCISATFVARECLKLIEAARKGCTLTLAEGVIYTLLQKPN